MSRSGNWNLPTSGPASMDTLMSRIQANVDALLSCNSDASQPGYRQAGTIWLQTSSTPWQLRFYDGSSWITMATVDPATHAITWAIGVLPVVGTVSQSGGVPTGAIVERGSNSNGDFMRLVDGTQFCWSPNFTIDVTSAVGSSYRGTSVTWTYPASFVATPNINPGNSGSADTHWATARPLLTQAQLNAFSYMSTTARAVSAFAAGRWF